MSSSTSRDHQSSGGGGVPKVICETATSDIINDSTLKVEE